MKKVNIIYLLPELKGASGGAKVIYEHSYILNTLDQNISQVLFILKKISYKMKSSLSKRFTIFREKTLDGMEIK